MCRDLPLICLPAYEGQNSLLRDQRQRAPNGAEQYFGATGIRMRAKGRRTSDYAVTGLKAGGQHFPLEGSISSLSENGKRIYTTAQDMGEHPLFVVDIASGKAEKVIGNGSISAFEIAGDTLAFTRNSLKSGDQLFTTSLDGAPERAITQSAQDMLADVSFGDFEQFSFKGWNDETVHGYVVKPYNTNGAAVSVEAATPSAVALNIVEGSIRIANCAFATNTPVFVVRASAGNMNVGADHIYLNHPLLNNDPNAILFATANWGRSINGSEPVPVITGYNSATGEWFLYRPSGTFDIGEAYNVMIIKN